MNKPRLCYNKKQHKTSYGSGKFFRNLRASKNLWYNERNCKSGKHGRQHKFMHHKSRTKFTTTNNSNLDLKFKSKKLVFSNPNLLEDEIKCYKPSFVVKIAKITTKMTSMFYPTMSPIYVMITYPRSKVETTSFLLTFPDIAF